MIGGVGVVGVGVLWWLWPARKGPGAPTERVLSVWLVPPAEACTTLRSEMQAVATRLGLPMFEPHITLVGDAGSLSNEKMLRKLARLKGTGAVPIKFAKITAGKHPGQRPPWNQAAVAVVEENDPLLRLRRLTASAFQVEARWAPPLERPHLSLAYAESSPTDDLSAKGCAAFGVPASFTADTVVVAEVAPDRSPKSIWRSCQQDAWREVARISLM